MERTNTNKITFSSEDKIVIHDGFRLSNFKGNYASSYTVSRCFYDHLHEVEFVEFFDGNVKYCYPSCAFDILEE